MNLKVNELLKKHAEVLKQCMDNIQSNKQKNVPEINVLEISSEELENVKKMDKHLEQLNIMYKDTLDAIRGGIYERSLESDFTFTTIKAIQINKTKIEVTSFKDLLVKTSEYLYSLNSEKFLSMTEGKFKAHFSKKEDSTKATKPLDFINPKLFVNTNSNANNIVNTVKNMLSHFGIDTNKVIVTIAD